MRTAILIGVNTYEDLEDLRSPRADLRALEQVLEANGHFDRVLVLPDPTRTDAMEALEAALSDGRPGDLLFVSFSGHGVKDKRGRLHLAFRDTRRRRLETTAISAEVLKRMLEDSRMRSKVLLLDCCHGGAFADGFATRSGDDDHIDFERELSGGAGTYVVAASGALEKAREGDNSRGVQPSPFTSAVVRGLAGSAPDTNGDGWIDAVELYQYVHREVEHVDGQRVTAFALGVRGQLVLARHTGSATAADLPGAGRRPDAAPAGDGRQRDAGAAGSAASGQPAAGAGGARGGWNWGSYLDYQRDCLLRQSVLQQLPDANGQDVAVCEMGSEVLLSGSADRWRLTGRAEGLAREADKDGRPLRYGYPAVLFDSDRSERGKGRRAKCAPLFVMDVEMVEDRDQRFLVPVGEPELNRELLVSAAELDEGDIEELVSWFEVDWGGNGVAGLADKARAVCSRLGLPRVDDLVAGALRDAVDVRRGARRGAQNAAVLYRGDPAGAAVKQLVGDLDHHKGTGIKLDTIAGTALAVLSDPPQVLRESGAVLPVVTGLSNAAQEEILASAMGRVLTVATGAPGTGKTELITSVVTTAVAAGQSVLVASTNNTAVDEVVTKVNRLSPEADVVVRTGNQEKRGNERDILTRLIAARWENVDVHTAHERLAMRRRGLDAAQHDLAVAEAAERRLTVLTDIRRRQIGALPPGVAPDAFGAPARVDLWARRAASALESRWTGWWHRWRTRRSLGIAGSERELAALLAFLTTEREWTDLVAELRSGPRPEDVADRVRALRDERRDDSGRLLLGRVAEALVKGRPVIEERLRNLESGSSGWKGMKRLVGTVRAWATTSRSVRGVFPPTPGLFDLVVVDEASQCTVADLLPLLYRAKRALVIGDPHQLSPVNTLTDRDDRRIQAVHGLPADDLDDRSLTYTGSSAYHAAASALASGGGEVLWLDEHYRCHPDIVAPVNRRFYGDRLAVRTDTARAAVPEGPVTEWIDVRGHCERPGGRSCRNAAEAEAVVELLRELWTDLPKDADIGVVSPFTAQVREIERRLGPEALRRIRVGTAHTFQGGERDVMVVSPAAATGVHRSSGQWALRQQNLWNVAVTRARARLYVVGDRRYWSEQGGLLADFATDAADDGGGSADDARSALFEALTAGGAEPKVYQRVGGYACDLLVPAGAGEAGGTAVMIDRSGVGTSVSLPPGRALQRTLDRAALFAKVSGLRTVRVPAWRCLTEPEAVAKEIVHG
ncbi:AAA domain-containing protein [Nocardiopsis aegyptia]|uniref:caspase, EACC1-associated type n=1 Tax=Nocardiopsis aegyptia TaxID=220378 RepID=UPI0036702FCD